MLQSYVLSTLQSPTIDLVLPATVPVKVGLAKGAFASKAFCIAVEIGLSLSAVLSTLSRPTMDFVIPVTAPVKVGLALGAFDPRASDKPLTAARSRPDMVLPNDSAPFRNARPLKVVMPVKTAFVESALFANSSTLNSTELVLDARLY